MNNFLINACETKECNQLFLLLKRNVYIQQLLFQNIGIRGSIFLCFSYFLCNLHTVLTKHLAVGETSLCRILHSLVFSSFSVFFLITEIDW